MNFIKVTLLILFLLGPTIESAQAGIHIGSTGRSTSSSAFKSGFSSQKSGTIGHEAASVSAKKSSFGSFGTTATPPSPASPGASSALSKDLNATTANANALKTLDARSQAAIQPTPLTGARYTTGGSVPPGSYATGQPYTQYPIPQTIIVQRNNGFFSNPFLWFMLGQSASHDRERVIYERASYPDGSDGNGEGIGDGSALPVTAAPVQKESLGASLLRVVLWLMILTIIGGGIIYTLARRAARIAKNNTHYTLGKI